ncbi:unnamed protein product [Penicillium salamii]|uniref:N-acetyltransferase domain-containing protein n=1 Tax=Penicillium salamii TaxID=1612424 RepID=A0A9W4IHF2_9EURO|nr:unnamed protein product [Penicillium salamii]
MDIVFHPGQNGSDPWVEFYPYTPSATAGYAFMAIFGISTLAHIILMFPFRAAYFIPLILGGICETFGYYGRAWSHESRFEISSWSLQEMLILCAPPLVAATVYMVLGRIIRSFGAEHLSSMRVKWLTFVFVMNDVLCFITQLGGAGVQVTGDENIMKIGKKVVLGGLIFSLVVFAFFIYIAAKFHRRLQQKPTPILHHYPDLPWQRYMWAIYVSCAALMVRNLVRTIQFGAGQKTDINTKEVYIYVFDAFLMFFAMLVLIIYHPGRLIKRARRLTKDGMFEESGDSNSAHILLSECEMGQRPTNLEKMHLIRYATEADGPAFAKVNVQSFQDRLLLHQIFPGSSQTLLQEYKIHVGMKHLANPSMHVLKIHSDDGELVTYSRWQLPASFGQSQVPLSDQGVLSAKDPVAFAPQPMNNKAFDAFKQILEEGRKRYTTEDDIVLDLLATLPDYQGQGYGTAMLKWGIEKADAAKSRIYLEATPEGVPVYLKYGWRHLEEVTMSYVDHGGVGEESFYLMIRDPIL